MSVLHQNTPILRLRCMRTTTQSLRLFALALCVVLIASQESSAQRIRRQPRASVTLLSDQILADAAVLRANGDFLVAAATARKLNAEAASQEMDNAEKWISTYFERRRLNREARAAENPGFVERLEKQQEMQRRLLDKNLAALGGDLSDELNWMLRDLLANTSYSIFMSDSEGSLFSSPDNIELTADDRHQIRVSEGKLAGGKSLAFRIDTAKMLETQWPLVLREKQFDAVRKSFADARDVALHDLESGKEITRDHQAGLMKAVDNLSTELKAAYPQRRRKSLSPQEGLAYITAQRCLRSLAMSTFRLLEMQSASAFNDSYRFQGKSVAELLQHMTSKGLEFAPPEPGGEIAYRKLYNSIRNTYLRLVPNRNGKEKE